MFIIEMLQAWEDGHYIFFLKTQNGKRIMSSDIYRGIRSKQDMMKMAIKLHKNLRQSTLVDKI